MVSRITVLGLVFTASILPVAAQDFPNAGSQQPPPDQITITPEEALERARELNEAGNIIQALDLLRSLLKMDPANVEANLLAAEILLENNDFNTARNYFKQVLMTEPSNFRANLGYGKILIATREPRQASAYLENAEKVAPADGRSEAKQLLALAYTQMGRTQKGVGKAQEAVLASPEDLDALQILIQIRQTVAGRDPRQAILVRPDVERFVRLATQAVERTPWNPEALARLNDAYQMMIATLRAYHNSFYQHDTRNQPTDRLLPGAGVDAAAVLIATAKMVRQRALLGMIFAEHDALLLAETATKDEYDPNSSEYLKALLSSYQQVQDLTAKLAGPGIYADTSMRDRAIATCRNLLERDPENEPALEYLNRIGAPQTTQPAPSGDSTD